MSRWGCSLSLFFLCSLRCVSQSPANGSEAAAIGLHGKVHTVLTEMFTSGDNANLTPTLSTFVIYDTSGYQLEEYRYEADGLLHSHTKYTRDGWRVFKVETTSTVPEENRTCIQSFDPDGRVSGTTIYDGNGAVLSRSNNTFSAKSGGATVSITQESSPNSTKTPAETRRVETIDAATGMSRQITTKDGKPYSDWLIQRSGKGKAEADVLTFTDGSFNQREVKPDGTTVEHKYWAPTKTHTYQTTDGQNRVLEVIDESPGSYTKTAFGYDKAGRQTEIANYDRSGKLLRKSITKYQADENGNWIEQEDSHWDATMGSKPPIPDAVVRRTITYH